MNLDKIKIELEAMRPKCSALQSLVNEHNKIIILGNGGSNSIASHIAQDYTKVLNKKALAFSDPSRLTCYINDYGISQAYVKFLEHFSDSSTLVILISSSGESSNIVNAAQYCEKYSLSFIALSGFKSTNSLNSLRPLLRYHVKSSDYGVVENSHQIFLHSIL